jgi:hypothetical protein
MLQLGIEELTAKAIRSDCAHDKLRAALGRIDRRSYSQFFAGCIELRFAASQLKRNQLAITLKQSGGDEFLLGVGEIGDSLGHLLIPG